MNFKKFDFLIAVCILFILCVFFLTFLNFILFYNFELSKNYYIFASLFLTIITFIIFLLFLISFVNNLLSLNNKLEKNIKQTIHELNIPVATIKINTQLIKKTLFDKKNLERVERIEKANDKLLKIYNNMEYEIKQEINKIEKEEFYVDSIIKESLESFNDLCFHFMIKNDVPRIKIYTDLNGFSKMIENLLSNAIKYNNPNNPKINITYENNILSIFNHGKPIDMKNLFVIFDRFFQENTKNDGFGLGLFLVKQFCDKNSIFINIRPINDGNIVDLNLKNIIKN